MQRRRAYLLSCLLVAAISVVCGGALGANYPLGDGTTLHVGESSKTGSVTAVILSGEDVQEAVTIGNASLGDVVKGKFCVDCPPAYFIPAHDRTSTYGATTGIVVYPTGPWWEISILPLPVAGISSPDAAGISWLNSTNPADGTITRYSFQDGFLAAN